MTTVNAMLNNASMCIKKLHKNYKSTWNKHRLSHLSVGIGLGNRTNCSVPFKGWLWCFYTVEVKTETHPFSLRSASPDTSSFVTIFLLNSVSANIRLPAVLHAGAMTSSVTAPGFESWLRRSGSTCFAETTNQEQHNYCRSTTLRFANQIFNIKRSLLTHVGLQAAGSRHVAQQGQSSLLQSGVGRL